LAASGDSIIIAASKYSENLVITKSLKLLGSGRTTIVDGGGINHTIAIENTAANVTLSKLTRRINP
jgi:nitrous oxidase accessory protein NosD